MFEGGEIRFLETLEAKQGVGGPQDVATILGSAATHAFIVTRRADASPCRTPRNVSHFSRVSLFDIHLWYMGVMARTPETQLIEALKKVDVYGDIAPPHVQDPMTMVLRQNAIQADLIRWDDSRGRFVLTGTGRNRITARGRTS
ncbi:MAG: hypothetical protein WAK69_08705, partial [Rhodoplanes sp.]